METTILNVKINPKTKKTAQKIANNLGLTLSGVVNGYLKQFIRTKEVYFSLNNEIPTEKLKKTLKINKQQMQKGEYYSFDNIDKALNDLNK